ncbi:MAG: 3-oxoadipate enol-lactonase [Betaproteobacteria bacterium]|nr:3-oxoadipate enol-lactonase [Betaproteobacteria bacterium]MDH5222281.1 3-oxoadipate enol-lactonase [Betaproteobacteria bacterium]MDH5351740.1 3-oxoadipate enol-lactonase [Betaproteobacteria bacterium]
MKAKTNGIDTNYELHGKEGAPWLVLSHSLACSVRMWDPQIAALKDSYRILAYDTRGHGASEAPKGAYTLEMLADDLKALLDALGVKNPHYCGLSMGGMIGQTFALKYPGVFRTLMLADTTSGFPAQAGPLWQERIKIAEEKGMQPLVQPTLERWFTEAFRKSNPGPVDGIAKLIASTPVAGYVGCCHAIPRINVTARLKEIKAPILVLCGDKDPGTPPAMSEAIRDNAPGSKLVMIPQAAHLSNLEQPALFTRAMQEFMAAH